MKRILYSPYNIRFIRNKRHNKTKETKTTKFVYIYLGTYLNKYKQTSAALCRHFKHFSNEGITIFRLFTFSYLPKHYKYGMLVAAISLCLAMEHVHRSQSNERIYL